MLGNIVVAPPLFKFGEAESDRAAHYSEMGNLLSLNVSVHSRRTDTRKSCGCLYIYSRSTGRA
jgi:hypothetical protein